MESPTSAQSELPALPSNEQRRSHLYARVGTWRWDALTRELSLEPETEQLYGAVPGTIRNYRDWAKRLAIEDLHRFEEARDTAFAERQAFQIEFPLRLPNGDERWILTRAHGEYDASGKLLRILGVDIDITEQKNVELNIRFVNRMQATMAQTRDEEATIRTVLTEIGKFLHAHLAVYLEANEDNQSATIRHTYGDSRPGLIGVHQFANYSTPEAYARLLVGKEIVVDDVARDSYTAPFVENYRRFNIASGIAMPYIAASRLQGGLMVFCSQPRAWRRDEIQIVRGVTARIFPAIEQMRVEAKLRENQTRLSAILEQLPIGVGVIDADGRFQLSNAIMRQYFPQTVPARDPERIHRWRAVDEQGKPIPPEQWPGLRALRGETVSPGTEFLYTDETGQERWLLISAVPFRNHSNLALRAIAMVQDIDERKRAEADLRDADQRKSEFLATLAHELRNPLAPIRNAVQLMKLKPSTDPQVNASRDIIDRQVTHMVRLIDDLMDVNRITHGKLALRKEPTDIPSVIAETIESCSREIENAGHRLITSVPQEPVLVEGDRARLAQVFSNLLDNASKYTDRGGTISVQVERRAHHVTVSIKDNGIGIPPDRLDDVFHLFAQIDRAPQRPKPGLGIGLALVKQLVEMHGGTIRAFSEGPGRGSEFVVTLPTSAYETRAATSEQLTSEATATGHHRIVIADDNADNAQSLATLLRISGNETWIAHDGVEAVQAAEEHHPDTVLLDIGMPKLNGYDTCERIRQQPWGKDITLIAITGWGQQEDRERSKKVGFDYHLVKPIDHQTLTRLLASHNVGDARDAH